MSKKPSAQSTTQTTAKKPAKLDKATAYEVGLSNPLTYSKPCTSSPTTEKSIRTLEENSSKSITYLILLNHYSKIF